MHTKLLEEGAFIILSLCLGFITTDCTGYATSRLSFHSKGPSDRGSHLHQYYLCRDREQSQWIQLRVAAVDLRRPAAVVSGADPVFPALLRPRRLAVHGPGRDGRRLAVDGSGVPYFSVEGCPQGDPLGPFYFAVGYHEPLC